MSPANNSTGSRSRGTIAGLDEKTATRLLVWIVNRPWQRRQAEVTRAEVLEELESFAEQRGAPKTTDAQRRALVAAFVKLPGVTAVADGVYEVHRTAAKAAEHRNWRFPAGQLDYSDAVALHYILSATEVSTMTPRLNQLHSKLSKALSQLR